MSLKEKIQEYSIIQIQEQNTFIKAILPQKIIFLKQFTDILAILHLQLKAKNLKNLILNPPYAIILPDCTMFLG